VADMEKKTLAIIILVLAVCGSCFAGYLYFSKLLSGTCPLTEPCPIAFFGQPACLYGFIMFFAILVLSIIYLVTKDECLMRWIAGVSFLGVAYGLYFSVKDLFFTLCPLSPTGKCFYSLGVPSCVYGLVMFIAVHIFSFLFLKGICGKKEARKGKKR
jgi:uncharacterized membrane protein